MNDDRPVLPILPGLCCLVMLASLISACNRQPDDPAPATAPAVEPGVTDPADIARRTVADFLAVSPDDVRVISLEAREFGDPGLGCPEPGMSYAQVITPGHVAIVEAEGRRFDVRVAGSNGRICRNKKPQNLTGSEKPNVSLMTERARKDLAAHLDVPFEALRQLDIRPATADNLPTGCQPECPGEDDICGYLIGIHFNGRRYDYHGVANQVTACPPILPR